jgi:hypothetical protein
LQVVAAVVQVPEEMRLLTEVAAAVQAVLEPVHHSQ